MERFKSFIADLPPAVRIWAITIFAGLAYIFFRYFQAGSQENFLLVDRIIAVYSFASLIVFLGFFMTSDPE